MLKIVIGCYLANKVLSLSLCHQQMVHCDHPSCRSDIKFTWYEGAIISPMSSHLTSFTSVTRCCATNQNEVGRTVLLQHAFQYWVETGSEWFSSVQVK